MTSHEFGQHYVVMLFPLVRTDKEGEKISPEYVTAQKAEAFAFDWMQKHSKLNTVL